MKSRQLSFLCLYELKIKQINREKSLCPIAELENQGLNMLKFEVQTFTLDLVPQKFL